MNPMPTTTLLRRNQDIIAAGLADETILLNASTWTYVHFNETATKIWELLGQPRTADDVVTALMNDYSIDRPTCEREVEAFVEEMAGRGFIVGGGEG